MKNNDFSNENLNPKDFLNSLESLPFVESYQELGFTLKSLCKLTQTALVMDGSYPNLSVHNAWDIYNILNLIHSLIPESEWELLDRLNKMD
ncbi:hypothetical protein ETU09_00210 [Apibacter muscae]|uniref:Uncharacterized protein n=1 Tax=Apibacter muscae TaxID=2509004 RepID=A0A563DKM2_9FLAO|nr:hypothetical protein [Apibacter muscae]TWP30775.1 hypothetical protein ETU09_00210 [Apibacter muscae]